MLVLSRNRGDVIWIGDDVKITVIDCSRGRTRIGIEAPPHISVQRDEVRAKLRKSADEHKEM